MITSVSSFWCPATPGSSLLAQQEFCVHFASSTVTLYSRKNRKKHYNLIVGLVLMCNLVPFNIKLQKWRLNSTKTKKFPTCCSLRLKNSISLCISQYHRVMTSNGILHFSDDPLKGGLKFQKPDNHHSAGTQPTTNHLSKINWSGRISYKIISITYRYTTFISLDYLNSLVCSVYLQ